MNKEKAVFNWSTGKDSARALHMALQNRRLDIRYLLTTVSRKYERVSQHGISVPLLEQQAKSIGIPLRKVWLPKQLDMQSYLMTMQKVWKSLRAEGITRAIFGDIYLDRLKRYRENLLDEVGISGEFPLWDKDTRQLSEQFIDLGFKAVIVSVSDKWLNKNFVGRIYNRRFLNKLPANVDPCGEHGEFHTFVFDAPIFDQPICWEKGKIIFNKVPKEKSSQSRSEYQVCGGSAPNDIAGSWYCELKRSYRNQN